MKQINLLCTVQRLVPPSKQLREQALWFGKFDKERLVTLLGYRMYRLNSSPDSILISIDLAASIVDVAESRIFLACHVTSELALVKQRLWVAQACWQMVHFLQDQHCRLQNYLHLVVEINTGHQLRKFLFHTRDCIGRVSNYFAPFILCVVPKPTTHHAFL